MKMNRYVKSVKNSVKKYRYFRKKSRQLTGRSEYYGQMRKYAHCLDKMKIDDDLVLYESYWGRGLVDSPLAIFNYLTKDPEFARLKHVWVVSDQEGLERAREEYGHMKNVSFVVYECMEYYEYLATAKYLINNVGFHPYFTKRSGQVYINTWHGTPLKSMGYETADGNVGVANIARNYLAADYLISANKVMTDMYLKSTKMEGILPGKIIEEGYPRNDILFTEDNTEIVRRLNAKGVFPDSSRTTVLYAPTWRSNQVGAGKEAANSLIEEFRELQAALPEDRYQVLVKPHQIVFNELKNNTDMLENLIPSSIDINELMCAVDVLVTDYSSVFFDFLCTGRPVVFYIPDADEYSSERGAFKISIDSLPGPICRTMSDAAGEIQRTAEGYVCENADKMRKMICEHEDGNASGKIVDIVWRGDYEGKTIITTSTDKKKLLINGGEIRENGITHAFLSLLNTIDYDEWDVTAFVDYDKKDTRPIKRINEDINPNARVLVRVGQIVNTESQEAMRHFVHTKSMDKKIWADLYPREVYEREFVRCFGNAEFDYIVDFNGFSRDNVCTLAEGKCKKKSIWMHSDMLSERERTVNGRKPLKEALRYIASRYGDYDNLVSCGKTVMEINERNLRSKATKGKFRYVKNAINKDRIDEALSKGEFIDIGGKEYYVADVPADGADAFFTRLVPVPEENEDAFVTMGRLSTEKNHVNLIEGFRMYNEKHPDSKLYILGDGPLRDALKDQIKACGLGDRVILTGNLSNPFAFMKRCDCFLLTSLYEGNPMVFHEARACGLSIISTDFETVKDVCLPDGQLIIGKTAEDICGGMCEYKAGNIHVVEEDMDEYNREVYRDFKDAIM